MIFSTKSTYGLRAMINLAKKEDKGSIALSQVAKEEKISLKYLERLFSSLKKAGLVKSVKGAQGGYCLAKSPAEIDLYGIVKALEGDLNSVHCVGKREQDNCSSLCQCEVPYVLGRVENAINRTLKDIKLKELV